MSTVNPRFQVGQAVRGLRLKRPGLSIEAAAADSGMSSSARWWRLEAESRNLDRWLADLDQAARYLGVTVESLIAGARVGSPPTE